MGQLFGVLPGCLLTQTPLNVVIQLKITESANANQADTTTLKCHSLVEIHTGILGFTAQKLQVLGGISAPEAGVLTPFLSGILGSVVWDCVATCTSASGRQR